MAEEKDLQEAFEEGRRAARFEANLATHEDRLNKINGSQERTANILNEMWDAIRHLRDEVGHLRSESQTRNAIELDRVKQLKDANDRQISGRAFGIGIATVVVTLVVGMLTVLATVLATTHAI